MQRRTEYCLVLPFVCQQIPGSFHDFPSRLIIFQFTFSFRTIRWRYFRFFRVTAVVSSHDFRQTSQYGYNWEPIESAAAVFYMVSCNFFQKETTPAILNSAVLGHIVDYTRCMYKLHFISFKFSHIQLYSLQILLLVLRFTPTDKL